MKVTFRELGGNGALALEAEHEEQERPSGGMHSPAPSSLCKVPAPQTWL